MSRSKSRDRWIHKLVELVGRGRPWFANKVVLVMWPGKASDFEKVYFSDFRAYPFAMHLEAGIFLDMHRPGWSYLPVIAPTPVFDLTLQEKDRE